MPNEDHSGASIDPKGHLTWSSDASLSFDYSVKQITRLSTDCHHAVNTSADSLNYSNLARVSTASRSIPGAVQEDSWTMLGIHQLGVDHTNPDNLVARFPTKAINYSGAPSRCSPIPNSESSSPLSASSSEFTTNVHLCGSKASSLQ
jgi:hypothetical protein